MSRSLCSFAIGCLALSSLNAAAEDEVIVRITHGSSSPTCFGLIEYEELSPGQSKTIDLPICTEQVNIMPSGPTVDIGRITLTMDGSPIFGFVEIVVGGGSAGMGSQPALVGRDWAGLNASGIPGAYLYGGINGDLTGSISVDRLQRFDAGGALDRGIQTDEDFPGLFIVHADSIGSTATIQSTNGGIARVNVAGNVESSIIAGGNIGQILIGGDMTGDISAPDGKITQITVGGSLGASGTAIDITADTGLTSLEADEIHADLQLNVGATFGGIQRIVTNGGSSDGDFTGSVDANNIFEGGYGGPGVPEIDIAGDLDASFTVDLGIVVPVTVGGSVNGDWTLGGNLADFINVAGDLNADVSADRIGSGATFRLSVDGDVTSAASITSSTDLTASTTLAIGGSLLGPISLGSGGLKGQIIVNSDNDGGAWSGDVTVGSTTLSPAGAYTQTGLGGGAVGLAPFDLHKQDCDPPYSGSTPPTVSSSTIDIDLVHYGPIKHDGTGKPFKVEKYQGHCTPPCIEPDADVTDDWSLTDISGRIMTISGPLEAGYHWHVYPMTTGTDMLKCDGLDAAGDVPVASYAYIIYREP